MRKWMLLGISVDDRSLNLVSSHDTEIEAYLNAQTLARSGWAEGAKGSYTGFLIVPARRLSVMTDGSLSE